MSGFELLITLLGPPLAVFLFCSMMCFLRQFWRSDLSDFFSVGRKGDKHDESSS